MKIKCNVHAASFIKGDAEEEIKNVRELFPALGLSGVFAFSYDYPLSVIATYEHRLTPDMTGEDLLVIARSDYEQIYREEDAEVGNPGHIPGMLNRSQSLGKFGIWGHDFGDLFFEGIEIDVTTRKWGVKMSLQELMESLLRIGIGATGPDPAHKIRQLGVVNGHTKSYKIVADFDYIYINDVPVISTFNDYHTAGDVFISVMSGLGPEYIHPEQ